MILHLNQYKYARLAKTSNNHAMITLNICRLDEASLRIQDKRAATSAKPVVRFRRSLLL